MGEEFNEDDFDWRSNGEVYLQLLEDIVDPI